MARKAGIGAAEMDIMRFIESHSPATVRQVAEYLAQTKGHTRTTALNIMERLREKGHLTREKADDSIYHYRPSVPKAQLLETLVHDFVEDALGGSLQPFVAYLVRAPKQVSDAELEELRGLVQTLDTRKAQGSEDMEKEIPQ